MTDKKVFALEECLERVDSDVQFLIELIQGFLTSVPEQIQNLEAVIRASDGVAIQRQAHTIKGALRNLGADRCGDIAYELEIAGRENELGRAPALLEELQISLKEYEGEVEDFANKKGRSVRV